MRSSRTIAGVAAAGLVAGSAAIAVVATKHRGPAVPRRPPTVQAAVRASKPVGVMPASRRLLVTLGLRERNERELERIAERGGSLTQREYRARFAPSRQQVARALGAIRAGGLTADWRPGYTTILLRGPAAAVERFFRVGIRVYRSPTGDRFYAPTGPPKLPAAVAAVTSNVGGLDNYSRLRTSSIRVGGVTPADVRAFYDIDALRRQGLTGAGETVVFPEIDGPIDESDLRQFAAANQLPPFDLRVVARWGKPIDDDGGEVMMDLEIVHSIAPGAKLVVYQSSDLWSESIAAMQAMVDENPGAIISDSTGGCEAEVGAGDRSKVAAILRRAAVVEKMTDYVASGDHGAYDCGIADPTISADFPSTLPTATSVGGTTTFFRQQPGYYREAVWSEAIDGWGSGGGVSAVYGRPPWQSGPGMPGGRFRMVPDVAALGDGWFGWHLYYGHDDQQAAGTSAAAPLWAGITALIDERLEQRRLSRVGDANPALYWIGSHQSRFAPKPFHDITVGENFAYHAGPGFDLTTGWGTPDAAALAVAWEAYERTGPASARRASGTPSARRRSPR